MKRSMMIRLTLATSVSALLAACSDGRPRQEVRCYQNPDNPNNCVVRRRSGWVPIFYPMFYNGVYYGPTGAATTTPSMGSPE